MKHIVIVATGGTIAGTGNLGKSAVYEAGKISIDEAQKRIQSYYEQRTDRMEIENDTREADIVSARIAKLLGEKAFQFSPAEWLTIHRRLFEGVMNG